MNILLKRGLKRSLMEKVYIFQHLTDYEMNEDQLYVLTYSQIKIIFAFEILQCVLVLIVMVLVQNQKKLILASVTQPSPQPSPPTFKKQFLHTP